MNKHQNDILLESGTNEVEIFEFIVDGQRYGVNALKVRQVTQFQPEKLQELPMMPDGMIGNVLMRDEIIRVCDVRKILNMDRTPRPARSILLLSEFNRQVIGFVVDEIAGISRVNWQNVQSPPAVLKTSSITGVAVVQDRKISMLDFESLILSIFGMQDDSQDEKALSFPEGFKILVADDSPMIRKKINWMLTRINATDIEFFENGALLLERYKQLHAEGKPVGLIISDIEMPQLDGLACCKNVKMLNGKQPFLIFSSLINEQIERKCVEVGADLSLNKEEFVKLRDAIEGFFPSFRNVA